MLNRVREWARRHTAKRRYSPVGIGFHWVMAVLISSMLLLGWYMGRLDSGGAKLMTFEWHMLFGLLTLVLSGLRLMWRLIVPGPVNDADKLGLQTTIAHFTHIAFYVCFAGLPVSGWLMWSAFAGAETLSVFGMAVAAPFPFENLSFQQQAAILYWAKLIHHVLVWSLLGLIAAHVGAALKHHFWDHHDVLEGMLPVLAEDKPRTTKPRKPKPKRSPLRSVSGSTST